MIDGRLARLTGTSSAFGMQLDSLADIVSFGVAPAHLAVSWSLSPILSATLPFSVTWLVAFLYVAACAVRLARFNVQSSAPSESPGFHMIGLPSPVAALTVTTLVMTTYELPWPFLAHLHHPAIVLGLLLVLGLLMVSRLPFPSYKRFKSRPRQLAFFAAIAAGLTLLCVGGPGGAVLCGLLLLYVVFGTVRALLPR
jgi:CDP-diacylglycerol--serine O-phosphatidyltransferase